MRALVYLQEAFPSWKELLGSAPCSAMPGWLLLQVLFPLGGQTEGEVQVISFLPRGWLCEGAS